ncbi:MAG: fused response regulator/phosphatase, partial [Acetobacteraceae bacterium]|nr:fused response regulator/phosphatase [Acetobacteraceae bacterium]
DEIRRAAVAERVARLGVRVVQASSRRAALATLDAIAPMQILMTDEGAGEAGGVELIRAVRARSKPGRYVYTVLLTSRADEAAMRAGLEAGADSFLYKPLNDLELEVGLTAAKRLLALQHRLERRNRYLLKANARIRDAYRVQSADLLAASQLQRALLPAPVTVGPLQFGWLFHPASQIGGDAFNVVQLHADQVAFFQIDVSGHGVPAALMSFTMHDRISRMLAAAVGRGAAGASWVQPDAMLARLNVDFASEHQDGRYFTMVFGLADTSTGEVALARAGHPFPLHMDGGTGRVSELTEGGPPVGLLQNAEFPVERRALGPGDRLIIHSDGVVDCPSRDGSLLGEQGLIGLLQDTRELPLSAALDELRDSLDCLNTGLGPPDDVSLLALEWAKVPHRGRTRQDEG